MASGKIFSATCSFQIFDVYVLVQIKGELTSARKVQLLKNNRKNDINPLGASNEASTLPHIAH
jgi:hypothetical protein